MEWFSSYQSVYNRNPNIPNVMIHTSASLLNITFNGKFSDHLCASHPGRRVGPVTVIGQINKTVFVGHGRNYNYNSPW